VTGISRLVPLLLVIVFAWPDATLAQSTAISGRVVDARTGQPLARALVHVDAPPAFTETDATGAFTLSLPAGAHTLNISLIGYATVRHTVDSTAGIPRELVIELSEGAGSFEEAITVTGAAPTPVDEAPAGSVLHGRDLQALRGVMLDDPLRAVQALPAAASTNDFYSEFSVRGSGFRHVGLSVDGIPAPYLIHTIHNVPDGGSIAMVNSEALGAASLLPGSYPQLMGRRLGAQVDLTTRDGNRDGVHGRAGLSGTSANAIVEGPLSGGKGAWVASVRRSYLDFLLDRIDPDGSFGFGFTDALGKITFDINPKHQVQLLTITGRSAFDEAPEDISVNDEAVARSRGWLAAATWRFTPGPRVAVTQRVYATGMHFRNVNENDTLLDGGEASDLAWRADVKIAPSARWIVDLGGDLVSTRAAGTRQRTFDGAVAPQVLFDYTASGRAASAYGRLSAQFGRLRLAPGARFDYWKPTDTRTTSPWITGSLDLAGGLSFRGGVGVYRQFPALTYLNGLNGNPNLVPERATHADLTIAQALARAVTVQITGFRRDERDVLRAAGSEPQALPDGGFVLGRGDAPWENRLSGRARGVEAMLRRDAPDGLSGWVAYAYGKHEYDDVVSGETFVSDFDQRHTFSAYALYRVSNRSTIGAKFRYGSNFPITGYVGEQTPMGTPLSGGDRPIFFGLTDTRNSLRLPAYTRFDLRADRAVTWTGRRVTLFVEVANVLNRRNERNVPYGVGPRGQLSGVTDSLLPIVPSAGLVIEF